MAVNVTTLIDGSKYTVVHVYANSDGRELKKEVLVSAKELDATKFVVESLTYSTSNCSARLEFSTDVEGTYVWVLPADMSSSVDFSWVGGFSDPSNIDIVSNLLLTTDGFSNPKAEISMLMKLRKKD